MQHFLVFILYFSLLIPVEQFDEIIEDEADLREESREENKIKKLKEIKVYNYETDGDDCVLEVTHDSEICWR